MLVMTVTSHLLTRRFINRFVVPSNYVVVCFLYIIRIRAPREVLFNSNFNSNGAQGMFFGLKRDISVDSLSVQVKNVSKTRKSETQNSDQITWSPR